MRITAGKLQRAAVALLAMAAIGAHRAHAQDASFPPGFSDAWGAGRFLDAHAIMRPYLRDCRPDAGASGQCIMRWLYMAKLEILLGRYDDAATRLEAAIIAGRHPRTLASFGQARVQWILGTALCSKASIASYRGNSADASRLSETALLHFDAARMPDDLHAWECAGTHLANLLYTSARDQARAWATGLIARKIPVPPGAALRGRYLSVVASAYSARSSLHTGADARERALSDAEAAYRFGAEARDAGNANSCGVVDLLVNLGRARAARDIRSKEAVADMTRAASLAADCPAAIKAHSHAALAILYVQRGELAEALKIQRIAVAARAQTDSAADDQVIDEYVLGLTQLYDSPTVARTHFRRASRLMPLVVKNSGASDNEWMFNRRRFRAVYLGQISAAWTLQAQASEGSAAR